MDKNKKSTYSSRSPIRKVQIYTYHFPDGKVYIGYTSRILEDRHKEQMFDKFNL